MPPNPWDASLSAVREAVESIAVWLAIWQARTEPDAHARRYASDAIDAIDTALAVLHRIRAELVSQVRQADDEAAARADALLARIREGPPGPDTGGGPPGQGNRLHMSPTSSPPGAEAIHRLTARPAGAARRRQWR